LNRRKQRERRGDFSPLYRFAVANTLDELEIPAAE
jgi:hypothetical protein